MKWILDLIGMSAGGWLGWTVGAWVSLYLAFILGVVGTGVGLYATHRVSKSLLP